ncbi:MAG TPA: hypothetical protein DEW33_09990, partial [Lachnospiraceae bacterium]|nr:hypothetical protein [Lachnospiraceae bacterium]
GGQCSFYCRFPIESRFLKDFRTKKQVVFDTTLCKKEEKEMNKFKATLSRLIMAAVWGVAITTLTSTSRYLTYQPKGEEELMRRYL